MRNMITVAILGPAPYKNHPSPLNDTKDTIQRKKHKMASSGWLVWECIVFGIFIFATSLAPLLMRKKDAKAAGGDKKRAFIFAGGGVSIISMILSVSRGTLGVRSFLGLPSELVYRGSAMWETMYGMILAFPVVCWVFVPVYYRLQTNSVYEYLEMRFNSISIRRLAAATFVLRQLLNLAVTVFTPTVALHAVLNLPHWASAAVITAVAIIFNMLGGLAAAIRADVIQTLAMIVVSGSFIIQATIKSGGPGKVLQDNIDGGRLQFFKFTGDPTVRVDTLSAVFGQLFMSVSIYGCQQTFVQRYCSMSSESKVRSTLLANIPAVGILFSLSWLVGMALYALYKFCDPLKAGRISAPDEVLPFYVADQFSFIPGMMGLFLGCLFNGALSFLVSNVNSLATVTWEDFVSAAPSFKNININQQMIVIKIIVVIYSLIIMGISLTVGMVGGVIEGSLLVTSATSGSLLGVFVLAALFPPANAKGALSGMISAQLVTAWLAVGRLMYVSNEKAMLPTSIEDCPVNGTLHMFSPRPLPIIVNQTLAQLGPLLEHLNSNRTQIHRTESAFSTALLQIYSITYMWYAVIGTIICVVVGIIVGYCTSKESDAFDERLLHPLAAKLARKFPGKERKFKLTAITKLEEKDSSEKTDETTAEDSKEDAKKDQLKAGGVKFEHTTEIFSTTSSRLFDAYENRLDGSPRPMRTRL